ncbi:single-stranded DNA-binding protein [Hoyosella rhizosphaerae]|uniref:Single-stranded DNA-binding protein n=1 Tax=Hoyosella rhizosphaerae TaxID=1755582 RepID=A0A916XHJ0_9ACTN|nr:single-stranded DNA-binding protein [Hoyosella rhizosphaerae]MBN4928126.1 single-stranded DNA-binding protein [Hoyosella rhizosphaerae]GGC72571.1 hypothetical protein GCM10011410_27070 [Hoyosella rhizosphaerae]
MYECSTTIMGNVITPLTPRTLTSSGVQVAGFTVVSTARVFDKDKNEWRDGTKLFVRVNCWNRAAANVVATLSKGDPVVVHGDLYNTEYTTKEGEAKTALEMRARAVGLDLVRYAPEAETTVEATPMTEVVDNLTTVAFEDTTSEIKDVA